MERKITLGITRDIFDAEGNLDIPGPGLKLLDEMPEIQYRMFDQFLPEITAQQIQGCDMVISVGGSVDRTLSHRKRPANCPAIYRGGVRPHRRKGVDRRRCSVLLCARCCPSSYGVHHHHLHFITCDEIDGKGQNHPAGTLVRAE